MRDCPFRYQGQYEDAETGLYYNRFRYYDPDSGNYISQDPIGLAGGMQSYGYVHDPNSWIDEFGLAGCDHTKNPKKKVNSADVGDFVRTPDSHSDDFNKKGKNYTNIHTGEIWQKSNTNHSGSEGGEWKVRIGKGVEPTPKKKITVSASDGKILKKDNK